MPTELLGHAMHGADGNGYVPVTWVQTRIAWVRHITGSGTRVQVRNLKKCHIGYVPVISRVRTPTTNLRTASRVRTRDFMGTYPM